MRRRFKNYLPIVLIALMVQIFAPVAACWAAAIVASDPLRGTEICHDGGTGTPNQPGDQNSQHGGGCGVCCLASANASLDSPPPIAFGVPYRATASVVWHEQSADLSTLRVGSNAQARAPPFSS
jgi:hypothetical protein